MGTFQYRSPYILRNIEKISRGKMAPQWSHFHVHRMDPFRYSFGISTLGGLWSISCGQYLDPTLGKFCPIYGPHLSILAESVAWVLGTNFLSAGNPQQFSFVVVFGHTHLAAVIGQWFVNDNINEF